VTNKRAAACNVVPLCPWRNDLCKHIYVYRLLAAQPNSCVAASYVPLCLQVWRDGQRKRVYVCCLLTV
jgi:hypothetical protein